jgi:ribosome-associated toxin RatA of RatAB toxin-antitoxin module
VLSGRRTITIEESPDAVLAVIADVERYPEWHPFFLTVQPSARDPEQRVVRADCTHNASVTTLSTELAFEYAPERVSARRIGGDLSSLDGTFEIEERAGASVVTHNLRVDPGFRLGLLLRGPVEQRVRTRVLDGALDGLAAYVAGGG